MQTETAMASALSRAGMNTTEFRLRQAARDALAKHHRNVDRALPTFKKLVDYTGKNELVDAALLFVLKELSVADQQPSASQFEAVSDRQANGDGHGQAGYAIPTTCAASSSANGAGQGAVANLHARARPVREPTTQERAAARSVSKQLAATVLDSFKIRDGRSIGDVRFGELERLRTSNAMEASVIRQIQRHAVADHDQRVRDVIKPDDLNRMIQKAAEVADAA